MKLKKILAASVAATVAVSAMAISASALVTKVDTITLDANSDTDKLVQYDMNVFGGVDKIDTLTIVGVASVGDGWCGGGGGVGFDSVAGWTQIDFALDGENVTLDAETGDVTVALDFTTLGTDTTIDFVKEGGLLQIGYWWGSGDGTLQITDLQINGGSVMGNEVTAVEDDETTDEEVAEDETVDETVDEATDDVDADADDVVEDVADGAADEDTADTTTDAATDTATGDKTTPDTGVEGVAAVAGLAIVAAGAVIIAKNRK